MVALEREEGRKKGKKKGGDCGREGGEYERLKRDVLGMTFGKGVEKGCSVELFRSTNIQGSWAGFQVASLRTNPRHSKTVDLKWKETLTEFTSISFNSSTSSPS